MFTSICKLLHAAFVFSWKNKLWTTECSKYVFRPSHIYTQSLFIDESGNMKNVDNIYTINDAIIWCYLWIAYNYHICFNFTWIVFKIWCDYIVIWIQRILRVFLCLFSCSHKVFGWFQFCQLSPISLCFTFYD